MGDMWTGVVESANEATREITIVNPDKKTETFVGVLQDGYQVKLKDGTARELKVSELKPGLRIRVFYKSKDKVNLINRIHFLGRDDYTRLREMLNLPPAIPVTVVENSKLPAADPFKIYLALDSPKLAEGMDKWAKDWNKLESAKHGRVEIVGDQAQADVSLVMILGERDDPLGLVAFPMGFGGGDLENHTFVTTYLSRKDNSGLQVLWERRGLMSVRSPQNFALALGKELEKRLKARSK